MIGHWAILPLLLCIASAQLGHTAIRLVPAGESIQTAVEESVAGDSVILGVGTHTETVIVRGLPITIGSQFLLTGDTAAIQHTIWESSISMQDTQSVLVLINIPWPGYFVTGISFSCGNGTRWTHNETYFAGGGIFAHTSRGTINSCRFERGRAETGGGMAVVSNGDSLGRCTVLNSLFRNCEATYWGGGIYKFQDTVQIENCIFDSCLAEMGGDALSSISGFSGIAECEIRNSGGGWGAVAGGLDGGYVRDCLFEDNGNWPGHIGVVAHLVIDGAGSVYGCTFRRNTGNTMGLLVRNLFAAGASFRNNIIEEHWSQDLSGVVLIHDFDDEVAYNIFRNNFAAGGGALYLSGNTDGRIHHNIFTGNHAPANPAYWGSAIVSACNRYQNFTISDNWISGNSGTSVSVFDGPNVDRIDVQNNWWGHDSGPYHETHNPGGLGDSIMADNVYYDPWLLSPPDTSLSDVPVRPTHIKASTWKLLEVFPNPFNNSFSVHIAGFAGSTFGMKLVDLLGREVAALYNGRITDGNIHVTAPSALANGVYFLMAFDESSIEVRKVVLLK